MTELKPRALQFGHLPLGVLFKIGFYCNIFIWGAFGLGVGTLAMVGYNTLAWNNVHVHGLGGLVFGLAVGLVFATGGAVMLMLGGIVATWAARRFGFGEFHYLAPAAQDAGDA